MGQATRKSRSNTMGPKTTETLILKRNSTIRETSGEDSGDEENQIALKYEQSSSDEETHSNIHEETKNENI